MAARRITYCALLLVTGILHFAYGQYVTHYMLLFLLLAPVLSVLLSLPAAFGSRTKLSGGEDVCRGRESHATLEVSCRGILPPEAWNVTVEAENLFIGKKSSIQKVKVGSVRKLKKEFPADTSCLGSIRYTIKKAFILDYLGLVPIPVKKGGSILLTVLPDKEMPYPEPELVERSARSFKPKPQGFSEEHELRPYRDGDPLNLIHWKLSRKVDDYIIREPQEIIRRQIVLVIDPPWDYEAHRSVLEQLEYLNEQLLAEQVSYRLQYGSRTVFIDSVNDYNEFIRETLSERMHAGKAPFPDMNSDALIYRISPGKEERNEA